jgi:hypothetical protein
LEENHPNHYRNRTHDKGKPVVDLLSADRKIPLERYIHFDIIQSQKTWHDLWFAMADHDATRYIAIKGVDVLEFWSMFDAWKRNTTRCGANRLQHI